MRDDDYFERSSTAFETALHRHRDEPVIYLRIVPRRRLSVRAADLVGALLFALLVALALTVIL